MFTIAKYKKRGLNLFIALIVPGLALCVGMLWLAEPQPPPKPPPQAIIKQPTTSATLTPPPHTTPPPSPTSTEIPLLTRQVLSTSTTQIDLIPIVTDPITVLLAIWVNETPSDIGCRLPDGPPPAPSSTNPKLALQAASPTTHQPNDLDVTFPPVENPSQAQQFDVPDTYQNTVFNASLPPSTNLGQTTQGGVPTAYQGNAFDPTLPTSANLGQPPQVGVPDVHQDNTSDPTFYPSTSLYQAPQTEHTVQYHYDGEGHLVGQTINGIRTDFALDVAGELPEVI